MASAACSVWRSCGKTESLGGFNNEMLVVVALALAVAPAALAGPPPRRRGRGLRRSGTTPAAQMDLAKLAGFDSIRMTAQWTAGMTVLPPGQVSRLQRAALFASMRGLNPIVSIYNPGGSSTPSRSGLPRAVRRVREDASSPRCPGVRRSSSATSRTRASTGSRNSTAPAATPRRSRTSSSSRRRYDGIKATRPTATVIGGALDSHGTDDPHGARLSHSPTTFIRDLGLRVPRERPQDADHGRLRRARVRRHVGDAAEHAAHRHDDRGRRLREARHAARAGVRRHRAARLDTADLLRRVRRRVDDPGRENGAPYTGTETATTVDEATQARYYAEAFRLALCQPNVIGIMVFHVIDESALGAWQSGPFYADRTPKSSVPAIRDAALAARARHAPHRAPIARRRPWRSRPPTAPCRRPARTASASARSASSSTARSPT